MAGAILTVVQIPVQFFQSVIAIEVAVTGALLWQVRYFESADANRGDGRSLPHPLIRLVLALVLGATVFGSLWAIANEGRTASAIAVTIGLAISVLPIMLRVLPPLARDASTDERDPSYFVTVAGLLLFVFLVAGVVILLATD